MNLHTKILVSSLPMLAIVVFLVRGCMHYGEVNAATYEHAKALYSICNRKDAQRLEVCAAMIEEAATAAQISQTETAYLNDIITTARDRNWTDALAMSRQLMVDQIDR